MKLKTKFNIITFLLLLITFQYLLLNLIQLNFLGFSLYLSLFLIFNFFLFVYTIKGQDKNNIILFLVFIFLYSCITIFRQIVYPSDSNLISELIMGFPLYLPPIFLLQNSKLGFFFNKNLTKILLLLLLMQFVFAVLFVFGLPTINLLDENHYDGYLRFVGIMGGANVNANFNSLITAILILSPNKFSFSNKLLILFLSFVSVAPSLTRLAFIINFIIFLYVLYEKLKVKKILSFLFIIPVIVYSIINLDIITEIRSVERIVNSVNNGGDQVRSEKYAYGFSLIHENITSFVLGTSNEKQIGRIVEFSDNSFIQLPLNIGVPVSLLLLILLIKFSKISQYLASKEMKIYIFILLLTLFLNNAILWIPWVFLATIGYWSISTHGKKQKLRLNG